MSNTKTVMGQASNQYVAPTDITDVFSTYLYTGNDGVLDVTNNIDLAGSGGMIWHKARTPYSGSNTGTHTLWSSETTGNLNSTNTDALNNAATQPTFNNDGYTFPSSSWVTLNSSSSDYVGWTFRKAPKFFDVVTWDGDGTSNRAIPHNLGGAVGSYFVKCTSHSSNADWIVWHKDNWVGASNFNLVLNTTAAVDNNNLFSTTAPDSSNVYLGTANLDYFNATGRTYVAYVFAHNDGDGGFGPDGSDIIKCGKYTGNGNADGPEIDLGFEPQWVLIKNITTAASWRLMDVMRGFSQTDTVNISPNTTGAEYSDPGVTPVSTGFKLNSTNSSYNSNGNNFIYIAIRRGPLAPPTAATEVFASDFARAAADGEKPEYRSGFPVDTRLTLYRPGGSSSYPAIGSRITGNEYLVTSSTAAGGAWTAQTFDYMNGFMNTAANAINTTAISHMWKRAPGFFDVVAYTGNGTAGRTVSHNLGVPPELSIFRKRSDASWLVRCSSSPNPNDDYYILPGTSPGSISGSWLTPTDTTFGLGIAFSETNQSGANYISYHFASLPGISKVGSYSGNGSSQNIDCGFTSGARFVLIKKTNSAANWILFDSARGIVSGNDPYLFLNTTSAEGTGYDLLDPYASGFNLASGDATINASGDSYIFYAIA